MARTNFFGQHSVDIWSSRNVNLGTGYTLKFNYANSRNIQGNGRGKVAQPTENDIQLIYFQFSEIMSAIKMLVVRRVGLDYVGGGGQGVLHNLAGCIREKAAMWHEIDTGHWTPPPMHMWLARWLCLGVVRWRTQKSGGVAMVAFYFCINSNKHDNEMTTEMSDTQIICNFILF